MKIKVEKIESGYSVHFPFFLKDNFKHIFKSAKWNAKDKQWEIGPRSIKRLNEWIKEVESSNIIKEMEEKEESLLSEKEIERIKEDINEIRERIIEDKELLIKHQHISEELDRVKKLLSTEKETLQTVKDKLKDQFDEEKRKRDELKGMLAGIIDFKKIELAKLELIKWHGKVGSTARNKFNEAQDIILNERKALAKAGYESIGLDQLYYANFNRPDRDNVRDVDENMILKITEYKDCDS